MLHEMMTVLSEDVNAWVYVLCLGREELEKGGLWRLIFSGCLFRTIGFPARLSTNPYSVVYMCRVPGKISMPYSDIS